MPERFWHGVVGVLVFGIIGIFLVALGFKVFDWLTPRMDIQKELAENKNIAVAIVCAAIILGICFLTAFVIISPS